MTAEMHPIHDRLRTANREARALLTEAAAKLRSILDDELIAGETPLETTTAMELALEVIAVAAAKLETATTKARRQAASPEEPTYKPDWIPPLDRPCKVR